MKYLYKFLLVAFIIILSGTTSRAGNDSEISQKLSFLNGSNNAGTDFWFSIPPVYGEASEDNKIRVLVSSPTETNVELEILGTGLNLNKQISSPNEVVSFELDPIDAQPVTHKISDDPPRSKIYKKGINLRSGSPVVVYVMCDFSFSSDGFLLIPSNTLGTHYINMVYQEGNFNSNSIYPPWTTITSPYDNNNISFTLGGGIDGLDEDKVIFESGMEIKSGETANETLDKGDVWLLTVSGNSQDISGSIIEGDKPFAVVSGVSCAWIPQGNQSCGYSAEMELPTHTWGKKYYVPAVRNRVFNGIIRIFAKEDNTTVYRDGNELTTIEKGGGTPHPEGYFETRLWPKLDESSNPISPRPAVIHADKPISVMYYNTGSEEEENYNSGANHSPFMTIQSPVEQFQTNAYFYVPNSPNDNEPFFNNYLQVIYQINDDSETPEDLLIAEVSNGISDPDWKEFHEKFQGEQFVFEIKHEGKSYAVKTVDIPVNETYLVKSDTTKFAAYFYGKSAYEVYGMPAALGLKDLIKVDSLPPKPEYSQNCDGNVNMDSGTVTDKPDDVESRSNLADIYLIQEESYNYDFQFRAENDQFIPGQTVTASWGLEVIDRTQDAKACVYFTDFVGNDTTICLEYKVPEYELVEDRDFGKIKNSNKPVTHEFYIRNLSETNDLYVSSINLKGSDQGFSIVGTGPDDWIPNDPDMPIPPEEERVVTLEFDPAAAPSDDNDRIYFDSLGVGLAYLIEGKLEECMFNYLVQVRAEVIEPIIEVTDVDFPPRDIYEDTWVSKSATIYNRGDAEISLKGISKDLTRPEIYRHSFIDDHPNISESNPLILSPGQSIDFNVEFNPIEKGTFQDSIVFESDAEDNIDNVCIINGEGTAPDKVVFENRSNSDYFIFSDSRLRLSNSVISEGFDILMIYDITGRVLFNENELNNLTIDLNQFRTGVYFIVLSGSEEVVTKKFEIVK